MLDPELKKLFEKVAESQLKTDAQLAKTDAQLAKTDAQLAKTDAKLERLAEMYGGISNNMGRAAEDFFFHTLKNNPNVKGIYFDFIDKNVHRYKNGIEDEFDILLVNGQDIMIIEVKNSLKINDIEKMLERKMQNFYKLFPEYGNYRVHIAFACYSLTEGVKDFAIQKGVILLQGRGEIVETTVY